jgi:DnaJ-class molecular chaperone
VSSRVLPGPGSGFAPKRRGLSGSTVVGVKLTVPKKLTKKQRELLEELQKAGA